MMKVSWAAGPVARVWVVPETGAAACSPEIYVAKRVPDANTKALSGFFALLVAADSRDSWPGLIRK
jgi:hypothetical protein